MKNTSIVLIMVVFLICVVTGYLITTLVIPDNQEVSTPVETAQQEQLNIILIHIDSFNTETPRVQSVWMIFLHYAERPSMGFLPLYQMMLSSEPFPGGKLSLVQNKRLPAGYLHKLETVYDLRLDGYLLLDDQAMITFANIFPNSPETAEIVYPTGEHEIVARICSTLESLPTGATIALPWDEVLPDHFSTEIPADLFLDNWKKLIQAKYPPNCEMLSVP